MLRLRPREVCRHFAFLAVVRGQKVYDSANHPTIHRLVHRLYKSNIPRQSFALLFFLFSLALFAFWLRSSVVSVLFSLISETGLRTLFVIILIFGLERFPLCLHMIPLTVSLVLHCLQVMRTSHFHCSRWLVQRSEEDNCSSFLRLHLDGS